MNAQDSLQLSGARRFSDAADIHSHPLPGIDDGATSLDASLNMLRVAARYGTSLLVATPHRYWQGHENSPDILRRLTNDVQTALRETTLGRRIQIVVGQEVPLSPETARDLKRGDVLTLGDTGGAVLVEPPFDHLPGWTADALSAIVEAGYRPILAHPERNAVIQRAPETVVPLVEAGAWLQLTAMSLTGENGTRPRDAAFWMLENGLPAVVASDSHSPTWRPPTLRGAFHVLKQRYGLSVARRLCAETPRALATGNIGIR